METYDHKA